MNEQKVLNYCGQIVDLCHRLKKQPPSNRYGIADGITQLTHNIKHEVQGNACADTDAKHG